MIIKEYKNGKKTICYTSKINVAGRDLYFVSTGSPKAKQCISWKYNTLDEAVATAEEYFENMNNFFNK